MNQYCQLFVVAVMNFVYVTLGPGGDLMLTSRIRNTNNDGQPFSFTFAYHTYYSVSDIRFVLQLCELIVYLRIMCYVTNK